MLAAITAGIVFAAVDAAGWLETWEAPLRDAIIRYLPRSPSGRFVVVAIDDASLESLGSWPWPRERLARLIDGTRKLGARGVALDIVMTGDEGGDAQLALSLDAGPSVLAAGRGEDGRWLRSPSALARSARWGHAELDRESDGVLRRISGTKQADGRSLSPFAAVAAELAGGTAPISVARSIVPSFRVAPSSIPTLAAFAVMEERLPRGAIDGAVVFIGVTAAGLGDRVPAPSSPRGSLDSGVRIHASAAEAILAGDLLHRLSPVETGAIAGLLVAAGTIAGRTSARRRLAAAAGVVLLPLLVAPVSLRLTGVVFPSVSLAIAAFAPFVVAISRTDLRVFRGLEPVLRRLVGADHVPASTEERARRLAELSEELDRLRREEVDARRTIVHELKTPLGSIRGLTQLLSGFDLTVEESRHVVELVGQETSRLASMIERLLELERLSLRDFRTDATELDLSGLVARRIEPLARSRSGPIRLEAPVFVPVMGASDLLERAVDNLLANAIKFSPPESAIVVRALATAEGALLEVEDQGPGVADEEREEIFKRFRRGRAARGTEGLGLGLALVAEAAAWHHGRVEVAATPTGGSLFRLRLPSTGHELAPRSVSPVPPA